MTTTEETLIDLNDSCSFFYNFFSTHSAGADNNLQFSTHPYTYEENDVNPYGMKNMMNRRNISILPFEIIRNLGPFEYTILTMRLSLFFEQLIGADKKVLQKCMQYFHSPFRAHGNTTICTILKKNFVEKLRECCNEEELLKRREEDTSVLSYKLGWISTLFEEICGKLPSNGNKFSIDKGLTFSLGNNLICSNETYRIIGFEHSELSSPEAIEQLLFTFPAMLIKKVERYPDQSFDIPFYSFITNQRLFRVCQGFFIKKTGSPQIKITLHVTERQKETDFIASLIAHIQMLNSDDHLKNFTTEALEIAYIGGTLNDMYSHIFKALTQQKNVSRKPSDKHKEMVKKKSESILRDISNYYQPGTKKKKKKQKVNDIN